MQIGDPSQFLHFVAYVNPSPVSKYGVALENFGILASHSYQCKTINYLMGSWPLMLLRWPNIGAKLLAEI